MDTRPTHLARTGPDGKTEFVCGAKRKGNTLPFVGADHAQAHIDGRGMTPCPECITTPEQLVIPVDTPLGRKHVIVDAAEHARTNQLR